MNIGAADELTADYRSSRRRAVDCGGAGGGREDAAAK